MRPSMRADALLLQTIRKSPGLSLYELRKLTKWSNGKVDGSLRRLLNSKKILVSAIDRNGRRVNLVYPRSKKPRTTIEIPKSLLQIGNPIWKDTAFLYALDALSIGVTGERFPEWETVASFKAKINLMRKKNHLALTIPKKFVNFYHLNDKQLTKTIADNNLLLTINGSIIENRSYPAKRE